MGVGNQGPRRKYAQRGTARPAKKGQYVDGRGVTRFVEPGLDPGHSGKRRWTGEVVRLAFNGKGELLRRSKQQAEVYAKEADVPGLVMRQCPDPWQGYEAADIRTNVYFQPA